MNILLDPNVAYLVLVLGFLLAILALLSPGTGLLELGALFAIVLAGYTIYNLPINAWALAILLLGVFPFVLAMRKSGRLRYLVVSLIALSVGSSFLFRSNTWQPAVHPLLALVVSLGVTAFLWIIGRKALDVILMRPAHDLQTLIGAVGETRTPIDLEGTVYVGGENWSARSRTPIPAEAKVRVLARNGLVLEVEQVNS